MAAVLTLGGINSTQAQEITEPSAGRALIIGVSKYNDPAIRSLRYAATDARAVAHLLRDPQFSKFGAGNVRLLTSDSGPNGIDEGDATKEAIENGLDWLKETPPGQVAVFYFSGHGTVANGKRYIIAQNAQRGLYDQTTVRVDEINESLNKSADPTKRSAVVILDSCHSGGATTGESAISAPYVPEPELWNAAFRTDNSTRVGWWPQVRPLLAGLGEQSLGSQSLGGKSIDGDAHTGELEAKLSDLGSAAMMEGLMAGAYNRVTLASCNINQSSWEDPQLGGSVFTHYLLQGMQGQADSNGNTLVECGELHAYVRRQVADWAQRRKRAQTPRLMNSIVDDVALTRGGGSRNSVPPPVSPAVPKGPQIQLAQWFAPAGGNVFKTVPQDGRIRVVGMVSAPGGVKRVRVERLRAGSKEPLPFVVESRPAEDLALYNKDIDDFTEQQRVNALTGKPVASPQPDGARPADMDLRFEQEVKVEPGTEAIFITAETTRGQASTVEVQLQQEAPRPLVLGVYGLKTTMQLTAKSAVLQQVDQEMPEMLRAVVEEDPTFIVATSDVGLVNAVRNQLTLQRELGRMERGLDQASRVAPCDGIVVANVNRFITPEAGIVMDKDTAYVSVTLSYVDCSNSFRMKRLQMLSARVEKTVPFTNRPGEVPGILKAMAQEGMGTLMRKLRARQTGTGVNA